LEPLKAGPSAAAGIAGGVPTPLLNLIEKLRAYNNEATSY